VEKDKLLQVALGVYNMKPFMVAFAIESILLVEFQNPHMLG
jgi:hypothetical protein